MNKTIFTKDHKRIVKQLRQARIDAGFSQDDAAKSLGKTQSYVSKIESGQRRIDVVQLRDFAKIYGKGIESFLK